MGLLTKKKCSGAPTVCRRRVAGHRVTCQDFQERHHLGENNLFVQFHEVIQIAFFNKTEEYLRFDEGKFCVRRQKFPSLEWQRIDRER